MTRPRTLIIAEAGVNHNGSLRLAKQLIKEAADAGADAVKFQTFKADRLVTRTAPKAGYQKKTDKESQTQWELLKRLELAERTHYVLFEDCRKYGIEFLSTPFDEKSLDFLAGLGVRKIKLSSGEVTNGPLLLKAARTKLPIILSTGMSTLPEIAHALSILAFGFAFEGDKKKSPDISMKSLQSKQVQAALRKNVTLLHCVTEYPAPFHEMNLRALDLLREKFQVSVGLSDHTTGYAVAIAAVARGAAVIEKHFTLDRKLPGPDHQASLMPEELNVMVQGIRQVEEALGSTKKGPSPSERKNISIVRKSIVAQTDIRKGELLSPENITIKRPGTGLSPMKYWSLLGKKSPYAYQKDEVLIF